MSEASTLTTAMDRVRIALELTELAEQMLRQRLRRTRPDLDDAAVEHEVDAWYATRPGAEHGDAIGQPIDVRERFK
jgi:Rv0078B-related antitoxin